MGTDTSRSTWEVQNAKITKWRRDSRDEQVISWKICRHPCRHPPTIFEGSAVRLDQQNKAGQGLIRSLDISRSAARVAWVCPQRVRRRSRHGRKLFAEVARVLDCTYVMGWKGSWGAVGACKHVAPSVVDIAKRNQLLNQEIRESWLQLLLAGFQSNGQRHYLRLPWPKEFFNRHLRVEQLLSRGDLWLLLVALEVNRASDCLE